MSEKILITGGAGFIGSHLADELLEAGYDVRVLDSLCEQVHGEGCIRPEYLSEDVQLLRGDIRDFESVSSALKGIDAVVHFAAKVGVGQSMYQVKNYTEVNEFGTAVLLQALMDKPVRRLVVASSMSVYGEGLYVDDDGRTAENAWRDPLKLEQDFWEELKRPDYARALRDMESHLIKEDISYLHPSKMWEYPWALERANLAAGSRVLDAGCGASIFPIYLASLGHIVSAADLEVPEGLDLLHGVDVDYRRCELSALPFFDGYFDAVFCISVIEHLPTESIAAAMKELCRVLKPEGRLLLTTDFCENASERMVYQGRGESFRVDWNVFDEKRLRERLLKAPGLSLEGSLDLSANWDAIRPVMVDFHGYPYTSVGVCLRRTETE